MSLLQTYLPEEASDCAWQHSERSVHHEKPCGHCTQREARPNATDHEPHVGVAARHETSRNRSQSTIPKLHSCPGGPRHDQTHHALDPPTTLRHLHRRFAATPHLP